MTSEPSSPVAVALTRLAQDRADEAAWTVITSYTATLVRARAGIRFIRQRADVDDLIHDVLLNIVRWAPFADFDGSEWRFRAYLKQVLSNIERTQHKRRERDDRLAEELARDAREPEASVYSDEALLHDLLHALLDLLTPTELRIVHRIASGESRETIGIALGLSPGALAVRLFRIRVKVRNYLNDKGL